MNVYGPDELSALGRELTAPFGVRLGSQTLVVYDVLRLLPGRRLTAVGRTDAGSVVLKLFLGADASKYLKRELFGARAIASSRIQTPKLLEYVTGEEASWATFEYLEHARAADHTVIAEVARVLGVLHKAGFEHDDLHLGNFLVQGGAVWAVDGGAVRAKKRQRRNADLRSLAVLMAQLPAKHDGLFGRVFESYVDARGWDFGQDEKAIERQRIFLDRERVQRVEHYLKKALRDCTEFLVDRRAGAQTYVRRELADELRVLIDAPELAFSNPVALLKNGNSATVVRTTVQDRTVVVKRYNVKSALHRLRRSVKPRGRRAWLNGQRLRFLDIPAALPLALIEAQNRVSYLIMEDRGDRTLADEQSELPVRWIEQVVEIFQRLDRAHLSHGDMKATNLLVDQGELVLIDLDAMSIDDKGLRKDAARLLANWPEESAVQQQLRPALAWLLD